LPNFSGNLSLFPPLKRGFYKRGGFLIPQRGGASHKERPLARVTPFLKAAAPPPVATPPPKGGSEKKRKRRDLITNKARRERR